MGQLLIPLFDRDPQSRRMEFVVISLDSLMYGLDQVRTTPSCEMFDAFLEEALSTGRICPSKSPISTSVFFIKKKDGKLHFIQDYRALNTIT